MADAWKEAKVARGVEIRHGWILIELTMVEQWLRVHLFIQASFRMRGKDGDINIIEQGGVKRGPLIALQG